MDFRSEETSNRDLLDYTYTDRVVRGKMGHFVVPSNAHTKNSIKKAKHGILYDPMLR